MPRWVLHQRLRCHLGRPPCLMALGARAPGSSTSPIPSSASHPRQVPSLPQNRDGNLPAEVFVKPGGTLGPRLSVMRGSQRPEIKAGSTTIGVNTW